MARIIVVGASERKGSFCPQCRKKATKFENGVKCNRCGFFRWAEFLKYKSLDGIPIPKEKDKELLKKVMGKPEIKVLPSIVEISEVHIHAPDAAEVKDEIDKIMKPIKPRSAKKASTKPSGAKKSESKSRYVG